MSHPHGPGGAVLLDISDLTSDLVRVDGFNSGRLTCGYAGDAGARSGGRSRYT